MIQRIQSLFLLLAAACAFALFNFPFATYGDGAVETSTLFADSVFDIQDNVALLALFCLGGGLSFIAIFLFKNRKLQSNLGRFAIIANIIGFILAIILFVQERDVIPNGDLLNDGLGAYLPVLFLVFALLALRFISKDEKLVSSMDRLR